MSSCTQCDRSLNTITLTQQLKPLVILIMGFMAVLLTNIGCGVSSPANQPVSSSQSASESSRSSLIAAGPMLGAGGMREIVIWLQTHNPSEVIIHYWPKSQREQGQYTAPLRTGGELGVTLKYTLSDLKPNTTYHYELKVNGKLARFPYTLQFKTQARWHRIAPPPNFSVAIGSCSYLNLDEDDSYGQATEIFHSIAKTQTDAMIWLGDMVYLKPEDWDSRAGIFRRYSAYRAHRDLQPLLASMHHYAIWDDHDYGPNDGDRSYPFKGSSLDAFKTFWGNPSFGLPELPGIFGRFSWSDVDFFLLDNRTYRAPNLAPNTKDKDYLGEAQLTWLLDSLSQSKATFKIIASGSQVLNPFSRFESYARHPYELQRLLNGIKRRKIEGVVFISGDRHHTELNWVNDDPQFYPLYDFTSSPITSRVASSSSHEANNPRRVPGTFVNQVNNFGVMRFLGEPKNRILMMETRDTTGKVLWTHEIKAKDLKIP